MMRNNSRNNSRNNRNNRRKFDGEVDQEGFLRISLVNQGVSIRRRRVCPLKDVPDDEISYKNLKLLNKYLTERGKIVPSRISGVSVKKQKRLSEAIKRARNLALLSFVSRNEIIG